VSICHQTIALPPGAALVVDAVLLVFELDMVVLADIDEVVSLVPSHAVVAEVVDCICMSAEFNVKLRDAAAKRMAPQENF
jgi:hypothetical protein